MAVKNQLQPAQQMQVQKPEAVSYKVGGIDIHLDPDTVVNYLVSGDPNTVTLQEIVLFMQLCKAQGLNPFTREAYLVKYKSDSPAQVIVGRERLKSVQFAARDSADLKRVSSSAGRTAASTGAPAHFCCRRSSLSGAGRGSMWTASTSR